MMIAEVGDIENVSGSRIATPFAPPNPGRTPISTPSRMPTSMKTRFFQVSATANPPIRLLTSSSTGNPLAFFQVARMRRALAVATDESSIPQHPLDRPLGQRHKEPDLEQQEQRD